MNESINLIVPFREFSRYIYDCRHKIEEALELLILATIFLTIFNIILFYLIHNYRNGKCNFRFLRSTKLPDNVSRVLLVTAHPDDECMFFGPTLVALRKRNCRIFVLCMSRGVSQCIDLVISWPHIILYSISLIYRRFWEARSPSERWTVECVQMLRHTATGHNAYSLYTPSWRSKFRLESRTNFYAYIEPCRGIRHRLINYFR